ncbi:hypothetical protein [Enterococcus faecium]|uniref:hypothetical protein n=1 Tax=Enterococcus faecium TaxID=1352 RepID=UPI0023B309C7|nr:hypothetical protein [Enterococcus faecium]
MKGNKKRRSGTGRRIYSVRELLLNQESLTFYAKKEDTLSVPADMNKQGVFKGEHTYIVEKKELDNDEFYKDQTQNIRYAEWFCIIDQNGKILQKLPIAATTSNNRGAYFVIDRDKVTKNKRNSQQLKEIIASECQRNY